MAMRNGSEGIRGKGVDTGDVASFLSVGGMSASICLKRDRGWVGVVKIDRAQRTSLSLVSTGRIDTIVWGSPMLEVGRGATLQYSMFCYAPVTNTSLHQMFHAFKS